MITWSNDLTLERLAGPGERRDRAGTRTGFADLDEVQAIEAGLYVAGGASGVGTTTLMHQMAEQMAEAGGHVLYATFEQRQADLFMKSVTRRIFMKIFGERGQPDKAFSNAEIRSGRAIGTPEAAEAVEALKAAFGDRMAVMQGLPGQSADDIRAGVRTYEERIGHKPIVLIDSLELMSPSSAAGGCRPDPDEARTLVARDLRIFQEELGLPVFVLVHLRRRDGEADLADFDAAGGIQRAADVVWALQPCSVHGDARALAREDVRRRMAGAAGQDHEVRAVELACLRNRFGAGGYEVRFEYRPAYDAFLPVGTAASITVNA